jgi:Tol biopolymer transport system component
MSRMVFILSLSLALGASAPEGHIAYLVGTEPEDRRVYVMDLATGETEAVGPGKQDGAPVWSHDGAWVAFESQIDGGMGIALVRPDGRDSRFLKTKALWNKDPVWSFDNRRIAYTAGDGLKQKLVVYTLESGRETVWGSAEDPGGSDEMLASRPAGFFRPRWVPAEAIQLLLDSMKSLDDRIEFNIVLDEEESEDGILAIGLDGAPGKYTTNIYLVTPRGSMPIPESIMPSRGAYAEWAVELGRDGIAFVSNDGGDFEIFVINPRGAYDVSNHRAMDTNPVWSYNGQWIAFESLRGGPVGLYRVHQDTVRVFKVAVDSRSDNWWPRWSRDGKQLLHLSNRNGNADIFITSLGGGKAIQLTDSPEDELAPAWRPLPR